jgi:hypothetical protein
VAELAADFLLSFSFKDFVICSEAFSSVLLKIFAQTKKILANAASDTMLVIVSSMENPRLVPSFSATFGDKNKDGKKTKIFLINYITI